MKLSEHDILQIAGTSVIPGLGLFFTRKFQLAITLQRAKDLAARRGHTGLFDIAPTTFVFPHEFDAWRAAAIAKPDTIWISKPGAGTRGTDIYLIDNIDTVKPEQNRVLQEYIARPHLLGGYKYTLRVFVAVTSLDPLRVWIYPDGLTKLATQPYTADHASLKNRFIHLTNPDVLRADTSADFAAQRFTHTEYRRRLRSEGIDDVRLFQDINTVIAKSLLAVREVVLYYHELHKFNAEGYFMLLGYDILIDEAMRPWLIEVNAGPSLETEAGNTASGKAERQLKLALATDTFRLAGKLDGKKVRYEALFPSKLMHELLPCYEVVRANDTADLVKVRGA
jgi:hypothetical protein